jgi:hypothetical protein
VTTNANRCAVSTRFISALSLNTNSILNPNEVAEPFAGVSDLSWPAVQGVEEFPPAQLAIRCRRLVMLAVNGDALGGPETTVRISLPSSATVANRDSLRRLA